MVQVNKEHIFTKSFLIVFKLQLGICDFELGEILIYQFKIKRQCLQRLEMSVFEIGGLVVSMLFYLWQDS